MNREDMNICPDLVAADDVKPDEWMARAACFELMAMGLLLPVPALAETLSAGEYGKACMEVSKVCGIPLWDDDQLAGYYGMHVDMLFHELRQEYTRLFSQAPEPLITPYLGVWADQEKGQPGMLFVGKRTVEIERFMRRCGVAKNIAVGQINDPVDHIGTVCEFMKYLCLVNAKAVQSADTAEVRPNDFRMFHDAYFAPYALWCARRLRETSKNRFFCAMASLLECSASHF